MDIRTKKTRKAIFNAFIILRSNKPLEKITIRELTELAEINKATFYRHYKDIYQLSDSIENLLIEEVLNSLPSAKILLEPCGLEILTNAFMTHSELFNIVFSGSRGDIAVHKIHKNMMKIIYSAYPEYKNDIEKSALISALIYGVFHSYFIYKDNNIDIAMKGLSKLNIVFS